MEISVRRKIKPIEILGKLKPEEFDYDDCEVYLDDERAPKLIEEALLFFLSFKSKLYVQSILKEMAELGDKNA